MAPAFTELTVEERTAGGRQARIQVPRSAHGRWEPAADRPDPVELLQEQDESRVPELVPIRYGRMIVSPFTFYRGTAAIMAADLAPTPRTGLTVQLCGDAHLSNFGLFGTAERQLIFDINDFDETLPGPWEWDVKRLVASFEILGRELGFSPEDRRDVVVSGVREYRETMRGSVPLGVLANWHQHMKAEEVLAWVNEELKEQRLSKQEARYAEKDVAKARTRDHMRVFTRLANEIDGHLRFAADPPLIVPIADLVPDGVRRDEIQAWMGQLVEVYRRSLAEQHHPIEEYRWVDTARKVVGVGSVGTRAWVLLFLGRDDEDPLVLQAKEAHHSVLERYLEPGAIANQGQRVVVGQRLMQAAGDIFLGWLRFEGLEGQPRDYYVRQLHDWKGGIEVERLHVTGTALYARLCGSTLARAHARWGDRIAIASYLGKGDAFDRALAAFAVAYADQNERDYETMVAAVRSGRLDAELDL
jgi:uncharacterized protein (DUF2252 family)